MRLRIGWLRGLQPALISLALNLPLALAGVQRGAYDTYVHIFFADHYRQHWFELREFRWYGGFSVASYPPLVHQLIALLSWPLSAVAAWPQGAPAALPGEYRLRGEEAAYLIVLLAVLAAWPYAVTAFARIFVGPRAARWAGLLAIFWPAVGLAGWSFGQLPTLAATLLFLFALAQGERFVRRGERPALVRSVAWAAAAAAAHHAALLFAVFGGAMVVAQAVIDAGGKVATKTQRHKGNERGTGSRGNFAPLHLGVRAIRGIPRPLVRGLVWAALAGLTAAVVLWPFLEWSAGYQPQTPIDHASRHSFLADPIVTFTFFWPAYGAFLLLLPWAGAAAARLRRLRPLGALAGLLFVLGLGGTTPLPRWLFGANWEWLTYDRFALWAGLCLLPFAGAFVVRHRQRLLPRRPPPNAGAKERRGGRAEFGIRDWGLGVGFWALVVASALYGALLSTITHAQPAAVDLRPIAEFLAQGANDQWRYLTLGFGDQAERLAVLTTAGTPDGAYHTARELEVLRESGLGQLDAAVWQPKGVEALRPFLEGSTGPDGLGLRWIFVNHPAYPALLRETGWQFDRILSNGVELWRKDRVWPVAPWTLVKSGPTQAARWWGVAPLAALAVAALAALDDSRLRRAIRAAQAILFAGILLIFPIGWNEVIYVGGSPEVFLSYRGVLVFASDVLLLMLLAVWLAGRWMFPEQAGPMRWGPGLVGAGGLGLMAAAALSTPGSVDPWLSTALFLHLALLGGLYLYLLTEPQRWERIALLLTGQLGFQAALGLLEFGTQTTVMLERYRLPFLGGFQPRVPGASVVQTADGVRWLRAYGSLWHPNVLGAVLLVCLGGTVLVLLGNKSAKGKEGTEGIKKTWLGGKSFLPLGALPFFAAGVATLALSFSRSAWVGTGVAAAGLLYRLPRPEWRRLWPAAAVGAAVLAGVVVPYRALFFTRATADSRSPLERHSVEDRTSVAWVALNLAARRPLTGVGAGAFVQALAADPAIRVTREPVHSVPLLVLAETGLPGILALGALGLGVAREILQRRPRRAEAHVFAAILAGLLVMSVFDHFLWSSFPGRMLAVLALGLWAAAEGMGERKRL